MTAATRVRAAAQLPSTALDAQALIEQHLRSIPYGGRCAGCGALAPCGLASGRTRRSPSSARCRDGDQPGDRPPPDMRTWLQL